MHMREEEVMRATDIGMVPLGYGRFVRADDIVAVLPIDDGRGRGRRTYVRVAGLAAPTVASRSEASILADMKASGAHAGWKLGRTSAAQPLASVQGFSRRLAVAAVWSSAPDEPNRSSVGAVASHTAAVTRPASLAARYYATVHPETCNARKAEPASRPGAGTRFVADPATRRPLLL